MDEAFWERVGLAMASPEASIPLTLTSPDYLEVLSRVMVAKATDVDCTQVSLAGKAARVMIAGSDE